MDHNPAAVLVRRGGPDDFTWLKQSPGRESNTKASTLAENLSGLRPER